jgi:hypothetical protein
MHNINVPYFFFTNNTGAPQGDTLGHIYPFFKIYSSYICNSFSSSVLIMQGVFDIGASPDIKFIEKSISLFGGSHVISLNTSSKSSRTA